MVYPISQNTAQNFKGKFSECHKYLNSVKSLNEKSVKEMPDEIKDFLRNNTPVRLKELAQMNCFAADKIKKYLDNLYGANNYILLALGRSISTMAELLKQKGADIKILPLSDLKKYDIEEIPQKDFELYKSFLNSIGLNKKTIENNKNKAYILMDYANYRTSLTKAKKLLTHKNMLGDFPNLKIVTINSVLENEFFNKRFNDLFSYCRFKDFSYVGKLPLNQIQNVFRESNPETAKDMQGNITKGVRKLFWFNVFDSIIKNDYQNVYPFYECRSIYKHFSSPKAVRNMINKFQNRVKTVELQNRK